MDVTEARDQVRHVLDSPEFQRELIDIIRKERNLIQAQERRKNDKWDLQKLAPCELLEIDKRIIEVQRTLYRFFECTISKLPKPPLICADDLQYVAFTTLGGINTADGQIQHFIDHVLMRISDDVEGEQIKLGTWADVGDASTAEYDGSEYVADLPNGFTLRADVGPTIGTFPVRTIEVTGYLIGICTTYAMQRLTKNIQPVVESLVQSMQFAATGSEMEPATSIWESNTRIIEDFDFDVDL